MPKTFATKEEKNQYERERRAAKRLKKQEAEVIVAPPVNVTPEPVAPQVKTQAELDEAERIRKLKYETPYDFYDTETKEARDARRKVYFDNIWEDNPVVPGGLSVAEFGMEDAEKMPHETKEQSDARYEFWKAALLEEAVVYTLKQAMRRPPVPPELCFVPVPPFRYVKTEGKSTTEIVTEQAAISDEIRAAYAHNERAKKLRSERCELIPEPLGPASPKPTHAPDGKPYAPGFPFWNEDAGKYFHSLPEWEAHTAREPWEIALKQNRASEKLPLTSGQ